MRRLTLMRHADAQWKDPEIADFARPLNKRGIAEAEAMARRLVELDLLPDLLLASPARRTLQTADIVVRELAINPRQLRFEEALYLAAAKDLLDIIRMTGPRVPHLMVIAHNPGISELARQLAPDNGINGLSTGAVCSITFDSPDWLSLAPERVRGVLSEAPLSRLFTSLFA